MSREGLAKERRIHLLHDFQQKFAKEYPWVTCPLLTIIRASPERERHETAGEQETVTAQCTPRPGARPVAPHGVCRRADGSSVAHMHGQQVSPTEGTSPRTAAACSVGTCDVSSCGHRVKKNPVWLLQRVSFLYQEIALSPLKRSV